MKIRDEAFFQREDVVAISRDLIGMILCSETDGEVTGGRIVETEAYGGIIDRASHAYGGRRTGRTETMYAPGGTCYIYLCYGIHHLFNVVTGPEGRPDAVLIRALEPVIGIETMLERRNLNHVQRRVAGGPGLVSQALALTTKQNGISLIDSGKIWLESDPKWLSTRGGNAEIIVSPRVGVDYAGEDAAWPWRFRLKGSLFTSPAK
ncbi:MAG: DNA-3-methyladenine glycosylase [Cyclonatronaceae bacterium]